MVREVVFSASAVRHWKRLHKAARASLRDAIRKHLIEADPLESGRNKFRLRRPSEHAEFELRVDPWRVFYRVAERRVEVVMIGKKQGNRLLVEGEEFVL